MRSSGSWLNLTQVPVMLMLHVHDIIVRIAVEVETLVTLSAECLEVLSHRSVLFLPTD